MPKDALGVSVHEARRVVADLLEKLGDQDSVQWLAAAKRFLHKVNPWPADLIPSAFVRDMTKKGWKLEEDVSEPATISIADLELVPIIKVGDDINGEGVRERAKKLGAMFGQRHAEYLLEHPEEIPKKFRGYCPTFPGTVWQRGVVRCIPYLGWDNNDGQWSLYFGSLLIGWGSGTCLLRLRK